MNTGCQLLEIELLDSLAVRGEYRSLLAWVLNWLIFKLEREIPEYGKDFHLKVIRANYHGEYLALGVDYQDPNPTDAAPMIEATANRILSTVSVLDLAYDVATHQIKNTVS